MDPSTDPGVIAPPADGDATATAPVETQPPTNGSEPVTNSGGEGEGQAVPFDRFQEVNNKAKEAEERARIAEERAAELESQRSQPSGDDDIELEPDTEKLLDAYVKKRGFVSQQELADERNRLQVQTDVRDLTDQYAKTGIPFEDKKVFEYANKNGLPITSKNALEAAYRQMNWDKIVEVERQRAIDQMKSGNSSSAEKPGSSTPTAPEEPTPGDLKSRIHAARLKLNR